MTFRIGKGIYKTLDDISTETRTDSLTAKQLEILGKLKLLARDRKEMN